VLARWRTWPCCSRCMTNCDGNDGVSGSTTVVMWAALPALPLLAIAAVLAAADADQQILCVSAVVPLTGQFSAWRTAADGLIVWAAAANAAGGIRVSDVTGASLTALVELNILDDGSTAAGHSAALTAALSGGGGSVACASTHVLIAVHPAFVRQDAVAGTRAGVLTLACCTPTEAVTAVAYGQDSRLLFNVAGSVRSAGRGFVNGLVMRGLRSLGIVFARNEPLTEAACLGLASTADAAGVGVRLLRGYDVAPEVPGRDAAVMWSWDSGLAAAQYPYQADSSGATPVTPPSTDTARLDYLADQVAALDLHVLAVCGLHADTRRLLDRLQLKAKHALQALFVYPVGANMAAQTVYPQPANSSLPMGATEAAAARIPLLQDLLGAQRAAYTTSAAHWVPDARFNDPVLTDTPTFVHAYRQRYAGRNPTWQAAAAAGAASTVVVGLRAALSRCVLLPGADVGSVLRTSNFLQCEDGVNGGLTRLVRSLEGLRDGQTVAGAVTFDATHANTGLVPLTLQLQADEPAVAGSALQPVIVHPPSQARSVPANLAATVATGDGVLPYPQPRGLVLPIPGSTYVRLTTPVGWLLAAVAGSGLCALCPLAACLVSQRAKPSVRKVKQPVSLGLLLGACAMLASLLVLLARPDDLSCRLRAWLPSMGLTLLVAPAVARLFHARKQLLAPLQAGVSAACQCWSVERGGGGAPRAS
jgi:hypothetical protein